MTTENCDNLFPNSKEIDNNKTKIINTPGISVDKRNGAFVVGISINMLAGIKHIVVQPERLRTIKNLKIVLWRTLLLKTMNHLKLLKKMYLLPK